MRQTCKIPCSIVAALALAATTAACVTEKSTNVLSPTVAGPIPGVAITSPTPVDPEQGSGVPVDEQPVTLVLENATSSGVRPLSYVFEIAADADFNNPLFERHGITPGEDGVTTLRLPDSLEADRSYYWRAKADDGANASEYSHTVVFKVFTPIVLGKPTPIAPKGAIGVLRPAFTIGKVTRSGPVGRLTYLIEVSRSDSFANPIFVWSVGEQGDRTTLNAPAALPANTQLFWRVLARDPTTTGPWSNTQSFRTPNAPAPPPSSGGGGGGGGGGGSAADELDLSQVTFLRGRDVSRWDVTSRVTGVSITPSRVCVNHTKAGRFPTSRFGTIRVEGNVWIFAKFNGRWYGATWDWLRIGQTCKNVTAREFGRDQIRRSPMDASWVPRRGDKIGFMMSTRARDGVRAGEQRSNVVLVTWPY